MLYVGGSSVAEANPEQNGAASPAAEAAEAAAEVTPRKEAEPGPAGTYTLDDWIAFRGACVDGEITAAGIQRVFARLLRDSVVTVRFLERLS